MSLHSFLQIHLFTTDLSGSFEIIFTAILLIVLNLTSGEHWNRTRHFYSAKQLSRLPPSPSGFTLQNKKAIKKWLNSYKKVRGFKCNYLLGCVVTPKHSRMSYQELSSYPRHTTLYTLALGANSNTI